MRDGRLSAAKLTRWTAENTSDRADRRRSRPRHDRNDIDRVLWIVNPEKYTAVSVLT